VTTTDDHPCMISTCVNRVDRKWPICRSCWTLAPRDLTDELPRTYMRGMTLDTAPPGLRHMLAKIESAVRAFFTAEDGRGPKYGPGTWERLCRFVRSRDEARARARTMAPAAATIAAARRRPDGWPLCPKCGEDELYSVANPPTEDTIRGCYNCNWRPDAPKAFRHLSLVP
jgi:hypothetical protein